MSTDTTTTDSTTTDSTTTDTTDTTASSTDTGYFKDTINTSDSRSQDTLALSTAADAVSVIDAFRSSSATSPWTSLDRTKVADRLTQIVQNPRTISQGSLNLCGPAAFFNVVASRHPVAVAQAATTLFDTGAADLGGLHIAPKSDLISTDYSSMVSKMTHGVTEQADWMLLGALRNSTAVFWQPDWRGNPDQELAGMTRPEEMASWFNATGFFSKVNDGGKWATNPGIPNAENLPTYPGNDNAILINTNLLGAAQKATPTADPGEKPTLSPAGFDSDHSFLLDMFPNHWVVLVSEVGGGLYADPSGGYYVTLSIWTWGDTYTDLWVPQKDFIANYYGAVTTFLKQP